MQTEICSTSFGIQASAKMYPNIMTLVRRRATQDEVRLDMCELVWIALSAGDDECAVVVGLMLGMRASD